MYSQSFTPRNLYFCTNQTERRNSKISKEELIRQVELCIGDSINDGSFKFQIRNLDNLYLNGQPKKTIEYLCQDLVLRKLYNNIKRIYGVEQANRNQIVKQMILLLQEKTSKWLIRLDVRHFYESIDRDRLIDRFQEDGRLNYQSICLLKNLFSYSPLDLAPGLPRGLDISSVMSELYMKYFDINVRRLEGVFYYARFVDDIIIFCINREAQKNVWGKIPQMLDEIGLHMNVTKSYKWTDQRRGKKLTYLGYTFWSEKDGNIKVTIAGKKVNMIKTRITKSFVRFSKDGDFEMLKKRIKFLTGNFTLSNPSTLLPIKVGIYFNYNLITEKDALNELDRYFQRILHCRIGRLGTKLEKRMTDLQRKELTKYSFVFGFEHHINHSFSSKTLKNITSCWHG